MQKVRKYNSSTPMLSLSIPFTNIPFLKIFCAVFLPSHRKLQEFQAKIYGPNIGPDFAINLVRVEKYMPGTHFVRAKSHLDRARRKSGPVFEFNPWALLATPFQVGPVRGGFIGRALFYKIGPGCLEISSRARHLRIIQGYD